MTAYENLVWTALPAGRSGSTFRLSVLLAPRLSWDGDASKTLGEFMDFRDGSWATIVTGTVSAGLTFEVQLIRGATVYSFDSVRVTRTSPNPDGQLFGLLFDSWNRPVTKWQDANWSNVPIRSFPLAGLSDMLDDIQKKVTAGDRPSVDELMNKSNGRMLGWVMDGVARASANAAINDYLNGNKYTHTPDVSTNAGKRAALAQLMEFLAPTRTEAQLADPVTWPTIEFHQMYSMFTSHPGLLRKLGFLFDLEVDTSAINQIDLLSPQAGVDLRVVPSMSSVPYPGLTVTHISPKTKVAVTQTGFELKSRTAAITGDGLINLADCRTVTSEVESESLAHWAMATDMDRSDNEGRATYNSDAQRGLPARHSAGIAIVRPGLAKTFHDVLTRSWTLQQSVSGGNDESLYAEDLMVGYRVDVRRNGTDWRSLHRRTGTLVPKQGSLLNPVTLGNDESYVEYALTDGSADDMRLPETLARWSGWSLALARPGKFLDREGQMGAAETALPSGINADIDYTAPSGGAQLPALRFGSTYELRLRMTDACGRSRIPSATSSSLTVTYRRHEPVPSPDVYPINAPTHGEIVEVMVVRSEGAGAAVAANAPVSRRLLTPARSSQWLAEQHGQLDDASGNPKAVTYKMLSARDRAQLDPESFNRATDTIPYLPDPMTRGLKLRGGPKPGAKFDVAASIQWGGMWPAVNALEIRLRADAASSTDAGSGVFQIVLAPGRVADLHLSSLLNQADLPLFDLWARRGSDPQKAIAAGGQWWQLTPDRVIRAVHAVRQPVTAPRFTNPGAWQVNRPAGQTAATATGPVNVDQPSTASVTLVGKLTSGIDKGPGTSAPVIRETSAGHIGSVDVPDPGPGGAEMSLPASVRVAMPDTRCRAMAISAIAASRFADFFRESRKTTLGQIPIRAAGGPVNKAVAQGTVRISWTLNGQDISGVEGEDFTVDHALGMIARTAGSALPQPPTLLSISWILDPITINSAETPVVAQRTVPEILPSSARPDPVSVAWVVPAFQWSGPRRPSVATQTVTSTRTGGTLRIYLNRPWWSSGLFEEFAIITRPPDSTLKIHDQVCSTWGRDPVILAGATLPAGRIGLAHFTNKTASATNVRIAEADNAAVDIARFAIGTGNPDGPVSGYDRDRDLWYVDVDIETGNAYRPFVRLGVARYQPNAGPAIQLSGITMLDILQLEPDRTATVTVPYILNQPNVNAQVALTGPSYDSNASGPGPGRAWLIYERSDTPDASGNGVDWVEQSRVEMRASYAGGLGTWTGSLVIPNNRAANTHRLVIEQFERWRTDGTNRANDHANATFGLRLVHQDILPL